MKRSTLYQTLGAALGRDDETADGSGKEIMGAVIRRIGP